MNTITQSQLAPLGRALFTSTIAATAFAVLLALPASARAASIGVNFFNNEGTLNSTDSAGASPFAQTNWTNVTTSSAGSLKDNTGTTTTASVTASGGSVGDMFIGNGLSNGDDVLNANCYFGSPTISLAVSGIPYANYTLVVYELGFNNTDEQSITLGGTTDYSLSPTAGSAGYLDGNAATPFTYNQATSTNSASPTVNGDYVIFTGLSGSIQTVTDHYVSGTGGSAQIGGFQIVATPEPGPAVLAAIGGIGLFAIRRRRQAAS